MVSCCLGEVVSKQVWWSPDHRLCIHLNPSSAETLYRCLLRIIIMTLTPPKLYRVQHSTSFTHHGYQEGFRAKGTYWMDYSHWFNRGKVTKHLDWKDRSLEPSPFISLFNNLSRPKSAQVCCVRRVLIYMS